MLKPLAAMEIWFLTVHFVVQSFCISYDLTGLSTEPLRQNWSGFFVNGYKYAICINDLKST